jgi:UDP-N-acetylmuramate--alanine ligase
MTTYGGDFNRLRGTFLEFLHHLPFYGRAVMCIDDHEVRNLLPEITRPITTYGFSDDADVQATDIVRDGLTTQFTLHADALAEPVRITLNLPGRHNVLNALAAICVALELNIDSDSICTALSNFAGIGRRFQTKDDCFQDGKRVMLIDDYAHHPREIDATLSAVRDGWPDRRLIMVFQPHRYSRTQEQFEDFVQVLSKADLLIISEVYAAGEEQIQGASGRDLSRAIRVRGQVDPVFVDPLDELPELLRGLLRDGDIVLTVGAGSIGSIAAELPRQLCQEVK